MLLLPLHTLQPSQLYISAAKLATIESAWQPPRLETLTPIPIKALHGRIIYTDGHTRAFAAWRAGFSEIPVIWDEDDLDWEAYQICVEWCLEAGIRTVMDLAGRVLPHAEYEGLWHERCRVMQAGLEKERQAR